MRPELISPTTTPALSDLLYVDPLGYDCIQEEQIELAFMAIGKTARLPRTCLPEPCRAALTRVQLASLIGRPPMVAEWDDYYSRYADHCRKEVVPFGSGGAIGSDLSGSTDPEEETESFWFPLVESYPASAPIRASFAPGSRTSRGLGSMGFGSGSFPAGTSSSSGGSIPVGNTVQTAAVGTVGSNASYPEYPVQVGDPDEEIDESPSEDPIAVAPLPAGLVLGLTGIACLALRRRRGLFA